MSRVSVRIYARVVASRVLAKHAIAIGLLLLAACRHGAPAVPTTARCPCLSRVELIEAARQIGAQMNQPHIQKLDSTLYWVLEDLVVAGERARRGETTAKTETVPAETWVMVQFRGAQSDLEELGFKVASIGPLLDGSQVAVGRIPTIRLADLAAIDHVVRATGGQTYYPDLNVSVPEILARPEDTGGLTGQGVVVGIIDEGFDWRHRAFRKDDGKTRVLGLWDQNADFDGVGTPSTRGPGVEYSEDDINDALNGPASGHLIKEVQKLTSPHGTHVAGIAAGNGSAAACCGDSGVHVGVAPKADLILVRFQPGPTKTAVLPALDFILNHPKALNKPIVINLSLGHNVGAHDGTDIVEERIDQIASQPGRAVVKSAGNEGNENRHVRASVPGNGKVEVAFKMGPDFRQRAVMDLWYPGGSDLTLEVVAPTGTSSGAILHSIDRPPPFVSNPSEPDPDRQGIVKFRRIRETSNKSGDHNMTLAFEVQQGAFLFGEWKLKLSNPKPTAVDPVHIWIDSPKAGPRFLPPETGSTEIRASADTTVNIPGTALGAITVAHFRGRQGNLDCFPHQDIAKSSGRGPVRRDLSPDPNRPNLKPTVAAPGWYITSASAGACTLKGECCEDRRGCERCCLLYQEIGDERTGEMGGTSLSAPHVTGAIALMFERNPKLDTATIVSILRAKAKLGKDPNEWGAGRIDVQAAIQAVPLPSPSPAPPPSPSPRRVRSVRSPSEGGARRTRLPGFRAGTGALAAIEVLRARLREVPHGPLLAVLVSRHFSEVRRLINTNRRVATLWHRGEGPAMLRRLLQGARVEQAPAPLRGELQRVYLERMFSQLRRYGSDRLRVSIEQYQSLVLRMLCHPLAAQGAASAAKVRA